MKNTDISQIVEVTISVTPTPTYSSLVDYFRYFSYTNKVKAKLTIEIDKYGDAYPCVQVDSEDEALLAEAARIMLSWNKGELEK